MESVMVALAVFMCCLLVGDGQTMFSPDGVPSDVTAEPTSPTSIFVTWEELPLINGSGDILYELNYSPLKTFEGTIDQNSETVDVTNFTITNLEENVGFNISVRAFTSMEIGPFSDPVLATTFESAPSSPPVNVTTMAFSPTSIEVMWNEVPPIDQNGVITAYEVEYTPLNTFGEQISFNSTNVSGSVFSILLGNLEEFVNYSISVRAYTSVGPGPESDDITILTLQAVPASPPTYVSVVNESPTTVNVAWNEVLPINQNGIVTMYEVLYTPLQDFGGLISANTTNISGLEMSVLLEYLQEYVNYSVSVRAYTEVGPGPRSDDTIVFTLESAPASPPSAVSLMAISPTSINVTWSEVPPIDQNGIIILYEIMYLPLNNFNGLISLNSTNVSGSEMSAILLDLEEYVNYSISIRAYTSVGPGPQSEDEIELTLEAAPSNSLTNLSAMASSSTSILVTWNEVPPIDQNGVITMYEVMYSQLNDIQEIIFTNVTNVSGSDVSVTLHYLQEYVNYSISVRAYTSAGSGPYSESVVELTLKDTPSAAPRNVSAMPTSSMVLFIQWETIEVTERNGEIFAYEITYTPQETFGGSISQESVNVSGIELSTNLTELQEFVNYTISIRAYTSVGAGPDSDEVAVRTLPSVPSNPPVNLIAEVNTSSVIIVSWGEVPPIDQNGIITMYEVIHSPLESFNGSIGPNGTNVSAAELSVTLRYLEEFVNYSITVRAINSEGPSNFSDIIMEQTLEDAPNGSPTITNVSVLSTRSVFVQWNEVPFILQNGIIADYTVTFVPYVTANQTTVNKITSTSNLNISVDGLVPNTMYNVSVTAATRIGSGPSSVPMEVETPPDAPGAVPEPPVVPSEAINATSVTLTWSVPPMPNGVITGYNVELVVLTNLVNSRRKRQTASLVHEACIPGGPNRSIPVDASRTSLTVNDAAPNVDYQFRVQASTNVGPGEFSLPRKFFTPQGAPHPVRNLRGTPTSNSIVVNWNIPLCPNGEITGYNIYYRQSDNVQTGNFQIDDSIYTTISVSATSDPQTTISNLRPFRNYTIIVRAMVGNNVGEIDVEILIRTLSDVAPAPTSQVPYLIPDPRQIDAGNVIFCAVVVVEGFVSGLSTYDGAQSYSQNTPFYITAAWGETDVSAGRVPLQIVIGDEQVYQVVFSSITFNYRNVPLKSGTQYSIFTRYDIRNGTNDNQPFRLYSTPVEITTQLEATDPVSNRVDGVVLGLALLGGVIVILVIVIILIVLIKVCRGISKSAKKTTSNPNAVSVKPHSESNQKEVAYEDIDQFQMKPALYEEVIAIESCPAYASTAFSQSRNLNNKDNDQYEVVNT